MKCAAYFRVSTKGQGGDDKLGLPAQRAAVERYCKQAGDEIVATFEDRASGTTADRPALAALLDSALSGDFQAVIVARWDRLARDTMLDGFLRWRLKERGVDVFSATEENGVDELSKLTQSILAAVAQYERHLIAQRLYTARKVKKSRGGYAGGRPRYGFKKSPGKELVPDEYEQTVLKIARLLRRQRRSYGDIASELNARGYKPRSGREWARSTVAAILSRSKK